MAYRFDLAVGDDIQFARAIGSGLGRTGSPGGRLAAFRGGGNGLGFRFGQRGGRRFRFFALDAFELDLLVFDLRIAAAEAAGERDREQDEREEQGAVAAQRCSPVESRFSFTHEIPRIRAH